MENQTVKAEDLLKSPTEISDVTCDSANDFNPSQNIKLIIIGAIGLGIIYLFTHFETRNILILLAIIIFSLMLLLGACEFVIEYATRLSRLLKVSELIIGLTIVSVGTSIPEISTSMISSYYGLGGVAVGDIYGSYITQLSLILGVVVLFKTESVSKSYTPYVGRDTLLMIGAIMINATFLFLDTGFSFLSGLILVFLYLLYLFNLYRKMKKDQDVGNLVVQEQVICAETHEQKQQRKQKVLKAMEYIGIIFGCVLLVVLSAQTMVLSSGNLAREINVSEHIIGVTIIAFGTAIPEFSVSVTAMKKNQPEIAYGNLVGSNIVDPLFSMGVGALVKPIIMSEAAVLQIITHVLPFNLMCGVSIIFFFSKHDGSKAWGTLTGISLIAIYCVFIWVHFLM
jgi:cation:H+ antiporter